MQCSPGRPIGSRRCVTWVWLGAVVWGAVVGAHESTLRAAAADMVPRTRLGTAYGIFTAAYGLAWLVGSTVIGALYDHSIADTVFFVLAAQAIALALFLPLAGQRATR